MSHIHLRSQKPHCSTSRLLAGLELAKSGSRRNRITTELSVLISCRGYSGCTHQWLYPHQAHSKPITELGRVQKARSQLNWGKRLHGLSRAERPSQGKAVYPPTMRRQRDFEVLGLEHFRSFHCSGRFRNAFPHRE